MQYITNPQGEITWRTDFKSGSSLNPKERYYYLNGQQLADIGDNGPTQTDYAQAIAQRSVLSSMTSPWGDASLWYLIADANGLNGTETLAPG